MNSLKERFIRGEKLNIELYDIHAHLGGYNRDYPVFYGKTEEIVREMERVGIRKAFVMPLGIYGTEVSYQNDKLISDCKKFSDYFIGFCLVNLNYPQDSIRKELDRCRENGIKGIKIIAGYQNYPPEGEKVEFVCEYANHYRMPILNHSWGSPQFLEKMVEKYPDVEYICGHLSLGFSGVVNQYENVWMCTCAWLGLGDLEEAVKKVRNDRLCWGSDFSDLHFGFTLGPILLSDIEEDLKRKILGENMKTLLKKLNLI